MDIIELIQDKYLNEPAIITGEYILTYRELRSAIASACKHLREMGIRAGERVGIISQNLPEYAILIIALWHIGAVSVPINIRWPEAQIRDTLQDIGCNHLISSEDIEAITLRHKDKEGAFKETEIHLNNEATIIFTSGSSGRPKAVVHTIKNHYYSALGSNMNISFGPGDVWGIFLPFYHVGGLSIIFRALISGGAMAIPQKKGSLTESIQKMGITHLSLVPTQLYRMLKDPDEIRILQRLKAILLGGAPASKSLVKRAKGSGLNIYTTYGSTEMASQITTTRPNDTLEHLLTSGKVLPFRELQVSNDGEIMVKGQTLFKGYWDKKGINRPFTCDGWFKTGDLGYLNKEGYLIVRGRKDNMFISGGENIQPEEIEQRLTQINGIIEAIVVPVEDEEWGQRPVAFVYPDMDKEIDEKNIKKILENYLPRYKIPDRIFRVPENIDKKGIKLDRGYIKRMAKRIMQRVW